MPRSSKNKSSFFFDVVAGYSNFLDMPREHLQPEIRIEPLMLLTEKIEALIQNQQFCKRRTNKQTQIGQINDK